MSRRPREFAGSPPLYSSPVPPHHLILPVVSPSCVCVSTRIITLCLITQTTPYGQWECRIDRHVDKCGGTVRCYLLCSLVTTLLTTFLAGGAGSYGGRSRRFHLLPGRYSGKGRGRGRLLPYGGAQFGSCGEGAEASGHSLQRVLLHLQVCGGRAAHRLAPQEAGERDAGN